MKVQPGYTRNYTPIAVNYQNREGKQNPSQNPSFGIGNPIVSFATFLEANGFLGEFLTVDTFGMAGPRTIQGYGRNSGELGHLNYRAGTEELIREVLSGPAYFFVPAGIVAAAAAIKGKCAKVATPVLNAFEPIMKKSMTGSNNAEAIKDNFIKNFMEEAFGSYKNERCEVNKIEKIIRNAVDGKKIKKKEVEKIQEHLTNLNKSNGKLLDKTNFVKLGSKEFPIKSLVSDIPNYLKDFTEKASKESSVGSTFIEKFHKRAKDLRNATNILGVAALAAFLVIIPRLYQVDRKKFPGLDGLDTENYDKRKEAKGAKSGGINENK